MNARNVRYTFTPTDGKVLSSATKSTPDDERTLFLSLKASNNFGRINVDELDLALG